MRYRGLRRHLRLICTVDQFYRAVAYKVRSFKASCCKFWHTIFLFFNVIQKILSNNGFGYVTFPLAMRRCNQLALNNSYLREHLCYANEWCLYFTVEQLVGAISKYLTDRKSVV